MTLRAVLVTCAVVATVRAQYLREPSDTDAEEGSRAELYCLLDLEWESGGSRPITAVWLRGERELAIEGKYQYLNDDSNVGDWSIFISPVSLAEDDAEFYCKRTQGDAHPVPSNTANLTVLVPPESVTMSLSDSQSPPAGLLQFTCVTQNSKPEASVTWWLNEEDITLSSVQTSDAGSRDKTFITTSTLTHAFVPEDNGNPLLCQAFIHSDLPEKNDTQTLHLVTVSSSNSASGDIVVIPQGEKLVLTCNADGYPEPSYTWFHDGKIKTNYDDETFVAQNVEFADRGLYWCEVASVLGSYKSINYISVTVLVPAESVTLMINDTEVSNVVTVKERTYEATCTATGSFPGGIVTWKLGENPIDGAETDWNSEADETVTTTSTLKYTFTADHNNKTFVCNVNVERLEAKSAEVQLNVQYLSNEVTVSGPEGEQESIAVELGGELVLGCQADGNPEPSYSWLHNKSTIYGETTNSYIKHSVTHDDEGVYQCIAMNNFGTFTSNSMHVSVSRDKADTSFIIVLTLACIFGMLSFILVTIIVTNRYKILCFKPVHPREGADSNSAVLRDDPEMMYDDVTNTTATSPTDGAAHTYVNTMTEKQKSIDNIPEYEEIPIYEQPVAHPTGPQSKHH